MRLIVKTQYCLSIHNNSYNEHSENQVTMASFSATSSFFILYTLPPPSKKAEY